MTVLAIYMCDSIVQSFTPIYTSHILFTAKRRAWLEGGYAVIVMYVKLSFIHHGNVTWQWPFDHAATMVSVNRCVDGGLERF